ncbi:MAG TPA: hypothetical protein PK156_44390, partial [Polyangium sp.]|nr:hypothetical protein [Polyangium sp.]
PVAVSNGKRTAGFVVAGVGAVGLIAAGATGFGIISTNKDIQAIDADCVAGKDCNLDERKLVVSRYRTLVWGNTAAWGIGIAGAAAGIIMILTAPAKTEKTPPKAAVAPVFLPGGAGLSISGRF